MKNIVRNRLLYLVMFVFVLGGCAGGTTYTRDEIGAMWAQDCAARTDYAPVEDNLSMHYLEKGEGTPMILIHGWFCSGAFWQPLLPELGEVYHVYAPDLMGCGISDKPLGDDLAFTTDNQARWVVSFMEKMGIEQAYVVGHSMGGETAAKVALLAPDRVKKLVLIDAVGMEDNVTDFAWYMRAVNHMRFVVKPASLCLNPFIIKTFAGLYAYNRDNDVQDEVVDQLTVANTNTSDDRRSLVKVTNQGLFKDFIDDEVPGITMPTLCIWGLQDRCVPSAMGEQYDELIPDSKLVFIDQAGHMVPWEQTDQVTAAILEFCN